jgi:transglutaminase-like putative cysteine protease
MKYIHIVLINIFLITASGCYNNHLIRNKNYREKVEASFAKAENLAQNRKEQLFSVFDDNLTLQQTEALKFLYAYMPLNDLAEYTGRFFLANADMSLRAREESPWGRSIPEDIFLHFVLPVRVNNENLDSFRIVCYDEIMNRVEGKNLVDAALEINHWCHEKVTYQPSDSRTSAPLSTMLSARGRCGEESTFTVAALRTAGIPARQVYTPRWAHSDDNHAWVEIWNDGKWYYMGACEPEPVIDRGWFTEPARRAMLVHTKAFGEYEGNEVVINRHDKYSEINNLPKYTVTKQIYVKTIDSLGNPVEGATVEYQLYNYAEFYPLASVPTDEKGMSTFLTGLGDLLIWGRKNDDFDFRKISVAGTDTLILQLGRNHDARSIDLDLDVPLSRAPLPAPSQELAEVNSKRIDSENSIRQRYIDTWISPEEAKIFASKFGKDSLRISGIISRSMGNYKCIIKFLNDTPDTLKKIAVSLLEVIAEKDLRDTRENVLYDHLIYSVPFYSDDSIFIQYVLNPRVSNEMLTPWRSWFFRSLPEELKINAPDSPSLITNWLNDSITIADDENYSKTALTPIGVSELKVSDTRSRAICFVALCRSLGIPARLEPGSRVPQFWHNSVWNDVYFHDQEIPSAGKGFLKLTSDEVNPVPEYYTHFTIARFENGRFNTLEYEYNKRINNFGEELHLTPGHYMMVTGNRINDSRILSNITFFDLRQGEHRIIDVKLRKDLSPPEIIGKIDLAKIRSLLPSEANFDNGIAFILIEQDKEPTKHVLNDLPLLKSELDARGILFAFFSESIPENAGTLPANSLFLSSGDFPFNESDQKKLSDISLPLIILSDKNGNILFRSEGYRIGIGEQILKKLPVLNK